MTREPLIHILLTGSRDYPNRGQVIDVLNLEQMWHNRVILMHGACGFGPDLWGGQWADTFPDTQVTQERRPVPPGGWETHGFAAGPRRNQGMVDETADARDRGVKVRCLAFISPCTSIRCRRPYPHDSHGASGCADMAVAQGIHTTRFRPTQENA